MNPTISVIIPACNAAATLLATLDSLQKQTRADWEAIVVDHGSTDNTAAIAHQIAKQDRRIRVLTQETRGVSAARNKGATIAQASWLLFLDAQDWIAPDCLAQMLDQIEADASLDVVHCGWVRVAADGSRVGEQQPPPSSDLFPVLAQCCPFVIHACMVKRTIFDRAGAFDSALLTCEDWDLWQRIARQGSRFGGVPEVLAYTRLRPPFQSGDGKQLFIDGLRVLRQGHTSDPRVANPHPAYRSGLPADCLRTQEYYWAAWFAGLAVGLGQNAIPLLALLSGSAPGLDAYTVANSLFESIPLSIGCLPIAWWQLWSSISASLQSFLAALEHRAESPGLAHRVNTLLERMILENAIDAPLPLAIGKTYGVRSEVTQPIADIVPPAGVERLYSWITVAGKPLGTLELPVCDGQVSHLVLKDSIAAQFGWQILGRFYEETVYQQWIQDIPEQVDREAFHDRVGWTFFLQDLWNRPDWTGEYFYDASLADPAPEVIQLTGNEITLEASHPFPEVIVAASELKVVLTVGGIILGRFTVAVADGKVSAQALRVAVTLQGGLELCLAAVREALLEQPFTQMTSLQQRLVQMAQQRTQSGATDSSDSLAFFEGYADRSQTLVLGRRHGVMGSSVCRWAMLPAIAAQDLLGMADITQEAIAQMPDLHQPTQRVVYAPDALPCSPPDARLDQSAPRASLHDSDSIRAVQTGFNNRNHFETLFATQPDPWKYTTPYEQTKYEQTLSLLPKQNIKRALELACAEGHFTAQLAPYVQSLLATDISRIAVERAAQRCAEFSHIQFRQLDMAIDPLPESLQLIVCSEVLYYIGGWEALQAFAQKVVKALEPGGYFLTAHAHLVVDEPDRAGYSWDHPFGAKGISDAFHQVEGLRLVKELRTPLYRIQLFQKEKPTWIPWKQKASILLELPQPTPPPERVADTVLWHGGQPQRWDAQPIYTDRLPILMYHRVAPEGVDAMRRWRLTPEAFAEQLHYLRSAGYYTISLATWQRAIATKTPLPGRAIVLTFDDGYLDFLLHAYPVLQAHGFSATVFLVADRVGQSNQWDALYGENVPLLNWEQIRQLQAQGIEFGSHSASHRPLTALSIAEIVKEGVRSRTILTQELGVSVQTIAYPYGDTDRVVEHLMGACGYTLGVSCRPGRSSLRDSMLSLPRIEIEGSDTLEKFIRKLS